MVYFYLMTLYQLQGLYTYIRIVWLDTGTVALGINGKSRQMSVWIAGFCTEEENLKQEKVNNGRG
jgi:hypothetical protein